MLDVERVGSEVSWAADDCVAEPGWTNKETVDQQGYGCGSDAQTQRMSTV